MHSVLTHRLQGLCGSRNVGAFDLDCHRSEGTGVHFSVKLGLVREDHRILELRPEDVARGNIGRLLGPYLGL